MAQVKTFSDRKISVTGEELMRVHQEYRRRLAMLDSPAYKTAGERHRAIFDAEIGVMRDLMTYLFGTFWDVAGNETAAQGDNILTLIDNAKKLPAGSVLGIGDLMHYTRTGRIG